MKYKSFDQDGIEKNTKTFELSNTEDSNEWPKDG